MRRAKSPALPALAIALAIVIAAPMAAMASPKEPQGPHTQNMHLIGVSPALGAPFGPPPAGPGDVPWDTRNTDLAFWGDLAIQGRYDGFRVIDISAPGNPKEIGRAICVSGQGDIGVYGNIVVRSVDSVTQTDQCTAVSQNGSPSGANCAPAASPCTGFEGVQLFDISDVKNIQHIASVPIDCGSHTHTIVPDPANGRFLIYNSVSGSANQNAPGKYGNRCPGPTNHRRQDIVEVKLDDPASAQVIGSFALGSLPDGRPINTCHDMNIILGSVMKAACAGNPGIGVYDISDLENPTFLFGTVAPTVTGWHTAGWTWDGKYIVGGWEPGGGTSPRCQETGATTGFPAGQFQTDEMKTIFIFDALTGEIVGRHILPRPQSQWENCTIHNYNIVPHPNRYLLVHGSYQSGTALVDFTDLDNAYEVAYMDPPPLDPPSDESPGGRNNYRGGDWSSYWYNGSIFESDARRGLYVWKVSDPALRGPIAKLDHLNPQTNHWSFDGQPGLSGAPKGKG